MFKDNELTIVDGLRVILLLVNASVWYTHPELFMCPTSISVYNFAYNAIIKFQQ